MPAVENTGDYTPAVRPHRKPKPAGVSPGESAIVDALDDVREEIRIMREGSITPKQALFAVMCGLLMFFASQVYMVGLIATSRGVDVAPAASATTDVVRAGTTTVVESAGVTTTVETKKTEPLPPPAEAPASVEP